ncbi:MAG: zf-HC2 domain-containing protein [Phycisphaerae bacterium]
MRACFRAIWLILTLSCEQSARLMSDRQERQLSLVERIALRGHVLVCRSCHRLSSYFDRLRDALSPHDAVDLAREDGCCNSLVSLSPEARDRILNKLDRQP